MNRLVGLPPHRAAHHSDPIWVSSFLRHRRTAPSSYMLLCSDFLLDRLSDVCHLNFVLFPFFHSGCIDSAESSPCPPKTPRNACPVRSYPDAILPTPRRRRPRSPTPIALQVLFSGFLHTNDGGTRRMGGTCQQIRFSDDDQKRDKKRDSSPRRRG